MPRPQSRSIPSSSGVHAHSVTGMIRIRLRNPSRPGGPAAPPQATDCKAPPATVARKTMWGLMMIPFFADFYVRQALPQIIGE